MRHVTSVLLLVGLVLPAHAHDSWISEGGHRNSAGEWCCGEADCFVISADDVQVKRDGYHLVLRMNTAASPGEQPAIVGREIVPFSEAQPSPDGAYWRCKRPDGTRRCFFAPPPNT